MEVLKTIESQEPAYSPVYQNIYQVVDLIVKEYEKGFDKQLELSEFIKKQKENILLEEEHHNNRMINILNFDEEEKQHQLNLLNQRKNYYDASNRKKIFETICKLDYLEVFATTNNYLMDELKDQAYCIRAFTKILSATRLFMAAEERSIGEIKQLFYKHMVNFLEIDEEFFQKMLTSEWVGKYQTDLKDAIDKEICCDVETYGYCRVNEKRKFLYKPALTYLNSRTEFIKQIIEDQNGDLTPTVKILDLLEDFDVVDFPRIITPTLDNTLSLFMQNIKASQGLAEECHLLLAEIHNYYDHAPSNVSLAGVLEPLIDLLFNWITIQSACQYNVLLGYESLKQVTSAAQILNTVSKTMELIDVEENLLKSNSTISQ